MEKYKGLSVFNFLDKFKTDDDCKEYLFYYKFKNGFICPKCNHSECWDGVKPFTKVCKQCRHVDSATANTLFHKVKFGLRKAFMIVFEMTCTTKSISSNQMSKRMDINYDSAWLFMRKVRIIMESTSKHPLTGDVIVDECVIGQYEKNKVGRTTDSNKIKICVAIETSKNIGIKRGYMMVLKDYSTNELSRIFDKHIDSNANSVLTDKWRGYSPLKKTYNLKQIKSHKGNTFKPMNRYIQGMKAFVRGTHHHISSFHAQAYLNQYSYVYNRHLYKETIFNKTIERMVTNEIYSRNKLSKRTLPTYDQRKLKIQIQCMVEYKMAS